MLLIAVFLAVHWLDMSFVDYPQAPIAVNYQRILLAFNPHDVVFS